MILKKFQISSKQIIIIIAIVSLGLVGARQWQFYRARQVQQFRLSMASHYLRMSRELSEMADSEEKKASENKNGVNYAKQFRDLAKLYYDKSEKYRRSASGNHFLKSGAN